MGLNACIFATFVGKNNCGSTIINIAPIHNVFDNYVIVTDIWE